MRNVNRLATLSILIFLVIGLFSFGEVSATCIHGQQACSASFGVGRYSFDNGGALDTTCSTNFCAAQTLGDTGIGNSASSNYQAQAGFNVNRSPSLELMVNTSNINLGTLSTTSTATATSTFSVKSYLSSGYAIETIGSPPQNGPYTLTALSTPTASQVGQEQFGINLVGNSVSSGIVSASCSTVNFGSNPVQVPSSSFSYGVAAHNSSSDYYDGCGHFMYKSGDTIATSNKSSGETDFTISYIFNITNVTPAGLFSMKQQLVAVATF